ncbi:MAG TPA: hypothetical protein PL085_11725 [Agriterribacter sp.]|uniref:hypothetical protein n=1 Tax=Agriterribacter sp. TaxID=2821509 RepID=UPI002D06D458|nr:hypothetical protein [Agriterribacter sp.]HRQ17738.1 hypothetical protein [Agriterribacter sp.]
MGAAKKNDEEEKKETEKKKQTTKKIAPLSKKRQKLQRVYRKQVAEALKKDNRCKVKSPVCIGVANGFQHIEKRSAKNLTDKKNQIPCCAACQTWIEENPKKAIEMGVSKSKFLSASVEG